MHVHGECPGRQNRARVCGELGRRQRNTGVLGPGPSSVQPEFRMT
jgi:hypothetical protein